MMRLTHLPSILARGRLMRHHNDRPSAISRASAGRHDDINAAFLATVLSRLSKISSGAAMRDVW